MKWCHRTASTERLATWVLQLISEQMMTGVAPPKFCFETRPHSITQMSHQVLGLNLPSSWEVDMCHDG